MKLIHGEPEAHLCNKGNDENADKERIAMHAGEDVVLAVDFARTDLVEERHHDERGSASRMTGHDAVMRDDNICCHHDERVEDDSEMLVWRRLIVNVPAAVDV